MSTLNDPKSSLPPIEMTQDLIFPQAFGFYKTSISDMVIALEKHSPPLFYITTHNNLSSKPSVILHSGPSHVAPSLATANLHSFSSTIDIRARTYTTRASKSGFLALPIAVSFPVEGGALEPFEWRSSSGPEVASLEGSSHGGMKLVRLKTSEVVVAWAGPRSGRAKVGKMRFMAGDRTAFGDEFEIGVVVSIAAIMERRRRAKRGAAGAGATGASG